MAGSSSSSSSRSRPSTTATTAVEQNIQQLIRGDESDAELDRIVADLLAEEARQKNAGGGASNTRAAEKGPARQAINTRFLNGVVRDVHSHNKRAIADAASAKAEASAAADKTAGHPSSRATERGSAKRRSLRGWSEDGEQVDVLGPEDERGAHSRRNNDGHDRRKRGTHDHRRDREWREADESDEQERRQRRRQRGENGGESDHTASRSSYRRSASPQVGVNSKMDRYFAKDYDPRLDMGKADPRSVEGDEAWERMTDAQRDREKERRDRKEERRIERDRRRRRKRREGDSSEGRTSKIGKDALDTHYTKRGATRDWDMGKNGAEV